MAAHKQALIDQTSADEHKDTTITDQGSDAAVQQLEAPEPWRQRFLRVLAGNLHYVTFLPLVLISVLQSINILAAAITCTGLVCLFILVSYCCYKAGHVKVFPKPYDLFNLALYGSMILLALFARDWLLLEVGLLTNAANACFMWATIILPCTDNFVMHTVRDRVPDHVARLPLMRRMALAIALTWALALTIMTAGSAIAVAARLHPAVRTREAIIAATVLGFGPLLLALPVQFVLSHVYRKRLLRQREEAQAAAAAQAAQPDIETGKPVGDV